MVFAADLHTDQAFELYSTPINGEASPVRLSGLLPSGTGVSTFQIAPDSSQVVYRAEQDTTGVIELYSVPLGAGRPSSSTTPW